jgi:mono/diheme cytochrome c family protein
MRRRYLAALGVILLLVAGCAAAWMISDPRPAFSAEDEARLQGGDAKRGYRIFAAADCGSCHTSPGQSDPLRLGGGLALASPFGTFRVPNISPDPVDGIGRWSTVDVANALVSGTSPARQHLYPAMPYTSYAQMKLGDIADLVAFLRTLPKVSGRAPPHEVPFPFSLRRMLGLWKAIYGPERGHPDADGDDLRGRGKYLVETLGHCAECHSTRNTLGAIPASQRYAGGPDQEGLGFSPNITPSAIGSWSVEDLQKFLATGRTPDLRFAGSSMVSVINNTRTLAEEDRHAMAVYLKSIPARKTPLPGS